MDVYKRVKDIRRAAVLLMALAGGAALSAQTPEAAASPNLANLPPHPPAVTKFFPLSQIHRGLQGVAYTVFEGTNPEPMGVEILGLLHNAIGPRQDMILARLEGAKADYTGVVAGMSGSPVYIDGELVGALSYRIGMFSKEPIAGITPIQQMLGVENEPQGPVEEVAAAAPLLPAPGSTAVAAPDSATPLMQPIETPLIFSGFSPQALQFWKQHAPADLMPMEGIGGSESDDAQPGPLRPGDAVSAVLVRGDLDISATCTVTYVDPHRMLACGHPITQFGPVSMPMTKAEVVATLPSPYDAFKIINTTQTIGSITEDRQSAIMGVFGKSARMIPVTLHVTSDGVAAGQQAQQETLHFQVIDQPQITPMAVMVAVYQGLMQENAYSAVTSYRLQGTVRLDGYPSVKLNSLVAPTDAVPANLQTALELGMSFARLYMNAARRTPIESVDLEVAAIPRRLTAEIEGAQVSRRDVHAGDTIMVDTTVLPWHGEPRNIRLPVTLPASLPPGPIRLLVSDGSTLDRLMQPPMLGAQPLDMSATIAQLNSTHPSDQLYVTLLAPEPQAAMDGHTLSAIPLSLANALQPMQQNRSLQLNGESAVPVASLPMNAVVSGLQVVTLHVEEQ